MVWVYEDSRLGSDEKKLYSFIRKRTDEKVALRTIRFLNLYKYLRSHKFRDAKHLESSAFFDRKHTRPVFNADTAEKTFKALKQKGGTSRSYPVLDNFAHGTVDYLQKLLVPEFIRTPINGVYSSITGTVLSVEQSIPILKELVRLFKTVVKVGDAAAETVAGDVGGPVGKAIVAIPVIIAGSAAALASVGEADWGAAIAQFSLSIPFIGELLSNAINTLEDYYREAPPATAGKRFSTRRRKLTKCPKTRRNKCA